MKYADPSVTSTATMLSPNAWAAARTQPIALPGCNIYIDPATLHVLHGFHAGATSWNHNFPVPNQSGLDGDLIAMQTWFLAAGEATNGLYLTLGR